MRFKRQDAASTSQTALNLAPFHSEANDTTRFPQSEVTLAKSEAVLAKSEAVLAKSEAALAKSEAVLAKSEAVLTKSEAALAKSEAALAKSEDLLEKKRDERSLPRLRPLLKAALRATSLEDFAHLL